MNQKDQLSKKDRHTWWIKNKDMHCDFFYSASCFPEELLVLLSSHRNILIITEKLDVYV